MKFFGVIAAAATLLSATEADGAVVNLGRSEAKGVQARGNAIVTCAPHHCTLYWRGGGGWQSSQHITSGATFRAFSFSGEFLAVGSTLPSGPDVSVYASSGGKLLESTWVRPPFGAEGDDFGAALAVSGSRMIVGAPGGAGRAGAVYEFIYDARTWSQAAMLTAASPAAGDRFGAILGMDADLIVLGGATTESFVRSDGSWVRAGEVAPALQATRVVVSGTRVATLDGDRIFVHRRDSSAWVEELAITATMPTGKSPTACDIALRDDRLAVGCAYGDAPITGGRIEVLVRAGTEWKRAGVLESTALESASDSPGLGAVVGLEADYVAAYAAPADAAAIFGKLFVFSGDATPKSVGAACGNALECASGYCVGGACCSRICDGGCESCVRVHTGAPDGTCAAVDRDGPSRSGPCDPYVCRDAGCLDSCATNGDCHTGFFCSTGRCLQAATCRDDRTLVEPDGRTSSCAPYRCAESGCPRTCASASDCVMGAVCEPSTLQCRFPPSDDGGCAVRAPHGEFGAIIFGLCVALAGRRRKR